MSCPNSSVWPRAAARESDGRSTIPSGTPMMPMGIWRIVKATL